jgi:hypothetical protein
MSNLIDHAMREFRACGWVDESGTWNDEWQKEICENVLDLVRVFADQGHSGSTAPYLLNIFERVAALKPLVPLTGADHEWNEVAEGVFQNNRCSHVFKQADRFDGQPYDIDAVIFWEWFRDENGDLRKTHFTGSDSFRPITFPYTPTKTYQFRPSDEFPFEDQDTRL